MAKRTIIMCDLISKPGSRFPTRLASIVGAESLAHDHAVIHGFKGRLPTAQELRRLFEVDPWPFIAWEWTSTRLFGGGLRFVGGACTLLSDPDGPYDLQVARIKMPDTVDVTEANPRFAVRAAATVPESIKTPQGWVDLDPNAKETNDES